MLQEVWTDGIGELEEDREDDHLCTDDDTLNANREVQESEVIVGMEVTARFEIVKYGLDSC